jgi:hypothetical protein
MKKVYESPKLNLISFKNSDVITLSAVTTETGANAGVYGEKNLGVA